MAKGQTPALTPEQADKYERVLQLKRAGLTFDQIAREVGYADRSGAKHAYDAAIKRTMGEEIASLRELEGQRMDELWRRGFQRALDPDTTTPQLATILGSLVAVSRRRASLYGLDAPRQVEVAGPDGGPLQTDVGEILYERLRRLREADVIDVDSDD
jgi:hypothetical protein